MEPLHSDAEEAARAKALGRVTALCVLRTGRIWPLGPNDCQQQATEGSQSCHADSRAVYRSWAPT